MVIDTLDRTVEFEFNGSRTVVDWPKGLPLPKEPNLPKGSRVIEMPNGVHKGVARDPIEDIYHCVRVKDRYKWTLADGQDLTTRERAYA